MSLYPQITLILILILSFFTAQIPEEKIRIVFYNVENLFDTADDPETLDEEFLPVGERRWTKTRFNHKIGQIARVIIASGGWESPDIIGLCEVENRNVVEQLIRHPLLKKSGYKIIHKESPDERGIDVSFLYKKEKFSPLNYDYIPIPDESGVPLKTREILRVTGLLFPDTVHFFFNHWPSRYGGTLETVSARKQAALTLHSETERIFQDQKNPRIIVMGDFNDQPSDQSIREVLNALPPYQNNAQKILINLSAEWRDNNRGTLKYRSQWQIFDQIMVSPALLDKTANLFCGPENASILQQEFLFMEDKTHGGIKPFRTYNGFQYTGGFSDHLPVYLDLYFR